MPEESTLTTKHGSIHIMQAGDARSSTPVVLLIHGNSSSSLVWHHILQSEYLASKYRIIALDLPGHGRSSDAREPENTYTMRGYAECAIEILTQLGVRTIVALGWSLGGHISLEMQSLLEQHKPRTIEVAGIMLIGTPPSSGPDQTAIGFLKDPESTVMPLSNKEILTELEAAKFAHVATGPPTEAWQRDCAIRTDGRARRIMFSSFRAGLGVDQVSVVRKTSRTLYGVVNGAEEPFVNLDYLDNLAWGRLWTGKCIRIEGTGHAPFWEQPKEFELILKDFLVSCGN